jgi:hypothetical protein
MSITRKVLIGSLILLIGIQFIRPSRNLGEVETENEISKKYQLSTQLHAVLKQSCYDCHSNRTAYPWYSNVQPIGWWLQGHVNEGKEHLNFSEFGTYPEKKAKHEFEEIEDAAANGWMPLESYVWMHRNAKLTPEQSRAIAEWAGGLK